ncbi:hypothetical protein K440DRAFT_624141 [Wilcoxina mikolae CBS 423.85]|nr:hypothetical protein K440DRAFT_624141 [Wilcoxina mikolae CBS 423.85]
MTSMLAHIISPITNPLEFIFSITNDASSSRTILIICNSLPPFRTTVAAENRRDVVTLQMIAAASNVKVVFASSLLHLRAFLATIPPHFQNDGILAVWGLVMAHRETSQFSVQGLGRTVASLVDAGIRGGRTVVVGECGGVEEYDEFRRWWEDSVPLLNTSVKLGSLGGTVMGKTVQVCKILGRWFHFPTDAFTVQNTV